MGMSVGGGGDVKSEPNVVPMIDVMLVLLIIFMIVTPIISAGFSAQMPEAKNIRDAADEPADVVLGIDRDGLYYLDVGDGAGEIRPVARYTVDVPGVASPTEADKLAVLLEQIFQNRDNKILFFRADNSLEYAHIEDAMDVARKAGVRVLAAVTVESRGEN